MLLVIRFRDRTTKGFRSAFSGTRNVFRCAVIGRPPTKRLPNAQSIVSDFLSEIQII